MLEDFTLSKTLISMQGINFKTATEILFSVDDRSDFASADYLPPCRICSSDTKIRLINTERVPIRNRKKRLKNALFF